MELSISCDGCVRRGTSDCQDCLVSFVLGHEPETLTMDVESATLADLLANEGLVPRLRYIAGGQGAIAN